MKRRLAVEGPKVFASLRHPIKPTAAPTRPFSLEEWSPDQAGALVVVIIHLPAVPYAATKWVGFFLRASNSSVMTSKARRAALRVVDDGLLSEPPRSSSVECTK